MGVLSMLVWALILVVTVRYVFVTMRADNRGEIEHFRDKASAAHTPLRIFPSGTPSPDCRYFFWVRSQGMTSSRPARLWIVRTIAFLMGALPIALLLAAMIMAVVTLTGETTLVGRRGGPWTSVPTWQAQAGALAILVPLMGVILWRISFALVSLSKAVLSRQPTTTKGLALGEPVLWQGRQGWRGFTVDRLVLMSLAAIGPALFIMCMWRLWNSSDILPLKLFWTAGALMIFGGSIFMVLLQGPEALQRCCRDLFGTMIVTDRRIAWLSPCSREVYREVSGTEIVSAFLVEGDDRRGWIGIVRKHRGTVEELDLRGVPHPSPALSALSRFVQI